MVAFSQVAALREGELPVLELPLDFARPAMQTFTGELVPLHVEADVVARLQAFGRACGVHGCTLFLCNERLLAQRVL